MSNRYKGGVLSATPPTTSSSAAPGIWTLEQQMQATAGTGWPFGGPFTYIEDVFSTYLYTGNSSTQTITNGIDLSTKGGLVWLKSRSNATNNYVYDTVRGLNRLITNLANGGFPLTDGLSSFNANGFSLGNDATAGQVNVSGNTYVSWTFREQPKFFDVVTYTGNGANRTIAHNLGSVPGCMFIKRTDTSESWIVYHRSLTDNFYYLILNSTAAEATDMAVWNATTPTASVFSVGTNVNVNASGGTYVAYLFAHNAGGFGLTGTDNVISCGSYTGNGSTTGPVVSLGYEPQWLMVKRTNDVDDWNIADNMRGLFVGDTSTTANSPRLRPNLSNAEQASGWVIPTATGFQLQGPNAASGSYNASGGTYIYIAIRRGPMKVPTLGTTVFAPALGSGTAPGYVSGFPVDLGIERNKGSAANTEAGSRLTGATVLQTNSTAAEANSTNTKFDYMNGFFAGTKGTSEIAWMFRRAPGFFDEVCFTPSAYTDLIYHNLGVAPEMIIAKNRGATTGQWYIHHTGMGASEEIYFNADAKNAGSAWTRTSTYWNNSSALFPLGEAHVAYLFATCAGVSKVGSYTGTATTKQIDCGFTAGSRFVLIKRTDSTGDWYVYDSARGIVSGNDPYLLLNSTGAEVTGTDYVDTYSAGFELSSTAPAALNANGGTYIFLAIA